jgi:hypothetical protein
MKTLLSGLGTALFALFLTGCTTVAPQYTPSIDNVTALKSAGTTKAAVGPIASAQPKVNQLSMRGTAMNSPYDNSYANYVAEALKQELAMAGRYAADANTTIDGTLLKNELDASGFSTGEASIEVRFVVKNGGAVKFDKVKSASHQWESSFAGQVAIPRAIGAYSTLVQKVLGALYADPEFAAALK